MGAFLICLSGKNLSHQLCWPSWVNPKNSQNERLLQIALRSYINTNFSSMRNWFLLLLKKGLKIYFKSALGNWAECVGPVGTIILVPHN